MIFLFFGFKLNNILYGMLMPITVMFSMLIFTIFIHDSWAQNSSAPWFLGSGLEPRTGYYYTICDYEYRFDASYDPCYDIMFSFEEMLQGPYGNMWMVQAKIEHDGKIYNAILHIDPLTFETKSSYSINRKYAESLERTLFWPYSLAPEYDPKTFSIGKSWGSAPLRYGFGSEMLVRERLSSDLPTYEIGYPELKMVVQEKYPFPIQIDAKSHPPASGDRFTVRISEKSSFDALKNQDNISNKFLHIDELIFNSSVVTTNASQSSLNENIEFDPDTLRMFSLVYDAIIKMVKNVSNVPELIP